MISLRKDNRQGSHSVVESLLVGRAPPHAPPDVPSAGQSAFPQVPENTKRFISAASLIGGGEWVGGLHYAWAAWEGGLEQEETGAGQPAFAEIP
jgi:hypothetical protein